MAPITLLDIPADYEGADPASIYYGHQIAEFRRLVYRTLVAFPINEDPKVSGTPVPDLATDTGTTPDGGKTWTFTLKDGIKWEDGTDITCEDFAYGLSRSFDDTLVNGTGPGTDLRQHPRRPDQDADGTADYTGPFTSTPAQQAAFDKAVIVRRQDDHVPLRPGVAGLPAVGRCAARHRPVPQGLRQGHEEPVEDLLQRPVQDRRQHVRQRQGRDVRPQRELRPGDGRPPRCARRTRTSSRSSFVQNPEAIFDRLVADSGDDQTAFATTNIPATFYSQIEGRSPTAR